MLHFAPKMTAIFLCTSVLAGCASVPDFARLTGGDTAADHAKKEMAAAAISKMPPKDLEGGVRQAQLMRFAGQYDEAIRVLSQLMLVASDDPRVVSEYGKTLAEKGRAQDATEFLSRAIELSSNDWTLYSALGVSYDQLGNQTAARTAYEHALALRPNEASVLNNYALSRMLAGDTDGARALIARAQAAGGATDAKIAANIALLNKVAPPPETNVAAAPRPIEPKTAATAMPPPKPAETKRVATATPASPKSAPAQNAPRPMVSSLPPVPQQMAVAPPPAQTMPRPAPVTQQAEPPRPSGVVMQAVPFDPYAGPVALHPPRAKTASAKADAAKNGTAPSVIDARMANIKPPVIVIADAKPADAKSKSAPVKTAARDQVPALRLAADARSTP